MRYHTFMYTIGEFAEVTHLHIKTLQKWDRTGRLKAHRTATNRRYYTDADVAYVLGESGNADEGSASRKRVVYSRVSSSGQKADLKHQTEALEAFCIASGKAVDEYLSDIGSGLNYERKQFVALMKRVEAGEIGEIVIAHKDRLVRFGYEWFELFCLDHETILTVMNAESLSPEQEMTQDLLAILHGFSSRLYGLRKYRKTIADLVQADDTHD